MGQPQQAAPQFQPQQQRPNFDPRRRQPVQQPQQFQQRQQFQQPQQQFQQRQQFQQPQQFQQRQRFQTQDQFSLGNQEPQLSEQELRHFAQAQISDLSDCRTVWPIPRSARPSHCPRSLTVHNCTNLVRPSSQR